MPKAYHKAAITTGHSGKHRRAIGTVYNPAGLLKTKRFYLGTDPNTAARASQLLETAWAAVEARYEAFLEEQLPLGLAIKLEVSGNVLWGDLDDPPPLHWLPESIPISEAARRGQNIVPIPAEPVPKPDLFWRQANGIELDSLEKYFIFHPQNYVRALEFYHRHYAPFVFVPADDKARDLLARGGSAMTEEATRTVRSVSRIEQMTTDPASTGGNHQDVRVTGVRLHEAIVDFADQIVQSNPKESGRKGREAALRLRASIDDMDLGVFGINALERLRNYWTARPEAKKRGGKPAGHPISLETVQKQLRVAKQFIQWLDRQDHYPWQIPRHAEQALKVNLQRLRTKEEVAALRHGVDVFTDDQLEKIYAAAPDRVRLWMLLGLNAGFTQAECLDLRWDEVAHDPPRIERVRGKSSIFGRFELWPETTSGLGWWETTYGRSDEHVFIRDSGLQYSRQQISNAWKRLGEKVDPDGSCWLSFKFLRKTAAQMVRNESDGEVAGVFLCHGQPVKSDELADVYSNRPFGKVDEALRAVRKRLQPMFDAVPDAFTS